MRPSGAKARQQQTSDMVWGAILAIALPVMTIVAVKVLDPKNTQWARFGEEGRFDAPPAPREAPLLRAHGEEMLKEIQRVYQQNYQGLFLQRFNAASGQDRNREFDLAKKTVDHCANLLARLKRAVDEPDSETQGLSPLVQKWDEEIARAYAELDRLNPIPKALRGG